MQFKASTDYGLRAVLYLAAQGHTCSSKDIAQDMSIPRDYLIQLAQLLRNAGIIEARPGKHGGYRLANDPSKITLLQVVNALDDDAKDTTRTRRKDRADASMVQGIKQAYDLILTGYDAYFDSITLQMLLDASQDESMGKELLAGRLIAESQRLPKLLPRRKRPNGGRSAAFHSRPTKKAPGWGLLSASLRQVINPLLARFVGADLGLPSRQERSSPLRGATKVAPYGFSQRDRSYAFAFFDASMRTSTSTAITMSTTPSASEIQGFFVKPAMM